MDSLSLVLLNEWKEELVSEAEEQAVSVKSGTPGVTAGGTPGRRDIRRPLGALEVHLYRAADALTGAIISGMVLFSPWAFGTTQEWAIWTMNVAGYALGLLLALKLFVREWKGYRAARWEAEGPEFLPAKWSGSIQPVRACQVLVGALSGILLLYCLISALNARATYLPLEVRFDYHRCVSWLPHSFDASRTWFAFWNMLGLACAFWAIVDWIPGKTPGEERAAYSVKPDPGSPGAMLLDPAKGGSKGSAGSLPAPSLPGRLRWLLWLLCVNGGLLALEGIVQRTEGSGRLLWLVQPRVNPGAEAQFGPWAYRANAAQYFNLLWPVGLGFWWTLHRSRGSGQWRHHLLLGCVAAMAACPMISTSKAGAWVSFALMIAAALLLLTTRMTAPTGSQTPSSQKALTRCAVLLTLVGALGLGFLLGWPALSQRIQASGEGFVQREKLYDAARAMAADYPVWGTGPGTFSPLFQLYRPSPDAEWPAQLHNDWLETRITFGWVGGGLILVTLLAILGRWFLPGGIHGGRRFVTLTWFALGGCLFHARFDFPFQIHSIVFLFVLLCAVLFSLTRRSG